MLRRAVETVPGSHQRERTGNRRPRPVSRNSVIAGGRALAVLFLAAVAAFCVMTVPALAGEEAPIPSAPPIRPLDFRTLVEMAIENSPYLKSASIEVRIKKLDETDAWYSYFPEIHINGRVGDDSSVFIRTNQYNPLISHISYKARQMISTITGLVRLKVIDGGIQTLGSQIIRLKQIDEVMELQDELIEVTRKGLDYARRMDKFGETVFLQVKLAEKELALEQSKRLEMDAARAGVMESIKSFLGLGDTEPLELDLETAQRQILTEQPLDNISFEEIKSASLDLKIDRIQQTLQKNRVKLAYAEYVPKMSLAFGDSDSMLGGGDSGGFEVGLVFHMPLWDGLSRYRNIERQRLLQKKSENESDVRKMQMELEYRQLMRRLASIDRQLELAAGSCDLAGERAKAADLQFKSGIGTYPDYLESLADSIRAKQELAQKMGDKNGVRLRIRQLSGGLIKDFVPAVEIRELTTDEGGDE